MSKQLSQTDLVQLAELSDSPVRTKVNRSFELPAGLYLATAGGYLAFLAIMTVCLKNPELALPMVVIVFSIIAGFGLCYKWVAMRPDNAGGTLSWGQFSNRGIQTLSGHLTAFEASAQVLTLPILIVFWGLCGAVVVAFAS